MDASKSCGSATGGMMDSTSASPPQATFRAMSAQIVVVAMIWAGGWSPSLSVAAAGASVGEGGVAGSAGGGAVGSAGGGAGAPAAGAVAVGSSDAQLASTSASAQAIAIARRSGVPRTAARARRI
ncbi:MAG: hypothetical protein OXG69_08560 [bacterium]|nr:hypothetical protein [bacterium]